MQSYLRVFFVAVLGMALFGDAIQAYAAAGFTVTKEANLRAIALQYSWRHDDEVAKYAPVLRSEHVAERLQAAWYLSALQGSNSISALLARSEVEDNYDVLAEICRGVWIAYFGDVVQTASPETPEACRRYLKEMRKDFASKGHNRLIQDSYQKAKTKGETALRLLLEAAAERFEVEVWRILADIYRGSNEASTKNRAANLLLVGIGIDVKAIGQEETESQMEKPGNLENAPILNRLKAYAKNQGIEIGGDAVNCATLLFRSSDVTRRVIAYRLLLSQLESDQ